MSLFPQLDETAIFFSRTDVQSPFASFSRHDFFLDDAQWPSVEHYFQAMKFDDADYQEKIRAAAHPKQARKLGRTRLKKIRKDWAEVRTTMMTRAVYIKCRTHADVAEALLETGERQLIESNAYDYYWGCGRDRRGQNQFGKVLMNVRSKLRQEQKEAA